MKANKKSMWRIVNPYKMAIALRENMVSQKEYILYVIIFLLMWVVNLSFSITPSKDSWINYVSRIVTILEFLIPLSITYIINRKADNNCFWYRFISISIPINVVLVIGNIVLALFY